MATIDIKLKTYEQLQFEIIKLNTDNYLKQQQLDKYKNVIDKIYEILYDDNFGHIDKLKEINKQIELLEEVDE